MNDLELYDYVEGIGLVSVTHGEWIRFEDAKAAIKAAVEAERALADKLHRDIFDIANSTTLPDGDGVNMPTLIWAEEWAAAIRARGARA